MIQNGWPNHDRSVYSQWIRVELAQHLAGVLAQPRRPPPRGRRPAVEVGRGGQHRPAPGLVGHLHHRSGGEELLVGQQVLDRVHGAPEEVGLGVERRRPLVQRAGGEDGVELTDQGGGVAGPAARVGEAGVGQPLWASDRSGQGRPVALALEPDDPEGTAVARGVVVDRRAVHGVARADRQAAAPHQRHVHVEADGVGALAEPRGRHHLAPAGAGPAHQGGADHGGAGHGGRVVAHAAALERERTAGRPQRLAGPGPEGRDVIRRPVGVGPVEPVARDQRVDEVRVALLDPVGPQAEAVECRGANVGEEDVGRGQQPVGDLDTPVGRQVEGDAALACRGTYRRTTSTIRRAPGTSRTRTIRRTASSTWSSAKDAADVTCIPARSSQR
jgi:hypothetical protein